jgi:hypothetical protein
VKPSTHPFHPAGLSVASALILAFTAPVRAQSSSELSQASLLPVAISVSLPVILVAGVGTMVVTGVQASAEGTIWLVENTVNGVRGSIRFAGRAVGAVALAVGTVITITVVGTGLLLSTAGHVLAFIPNETGRTLSFNQRVSQ